MGRWDRNTSRAARRTGAAVAINVSSRPKRGMRVSSRVFSLLRKAQRVVVTVVVAVAVVVVVLVKMMVVMLRADGRGVTRAW